MSKATKPIDIPLRASKKGLVGIGQNLLSDEGGSVELVVGKPTRYSKSAKEEIESDKIDILSTLLESNIFSLYPLYKACHWQKKLLLQEN